MGAKQARCPACGTAPRAGARFCDGCGATLPPQAPGAEYKQVTILFVDVTHSMDIAAAVGPERLREIMAGLFDRSTAVVERYGGTVRSFIGDGVMALFGAPLALEDHALRACMAALDIQGEALSLAGEIADRDGIDFKVRVGLNSGEVVAGDIGAGAAGYTVVGEQVGLAQRMESAAPPGGVMVSASTGRLVEHAATLGDTEWVRIKGAAEPMAARRLLGIADRHGVRPGELQLVGRAAEITEIVRHLEATASGRGAVVSLVGPPGIGKSRITREAAAIAAARGHRVAWTYCQSHTSEIPFRAATALLRSVFGIAGESDEKARAAIRFTLPGADPADLRLLDDLLGIGAGDVPPPEMDPDARKRRLTALLDSALLSRDEPAVYVIEDAHWIDSVSESMLSHFLEAAPRTPTLVLVTHRPEYGGTLTSGAATTVRLTPLDDDTSAALTEVLLGAHRSLAGIAPRIVERAAGNPFFIEEMVRDLAERGVLNGTRGEYTCAGATDVTVPATVQATIGARIDRLGPAAKRTLYAAAVVGSPFAPDLLRSVVDESDSTSLTALVEAELVAQVTEQPVQFAFRHPLMHAVAYESQLKSGRTALHRRIAAAIEGSDVDAAMTHAALIATHREAAGDLRDAFDWHMRAGTWSTHRDIAAARMSWRRAAAVADRLPSSDTDRTDLRIAPRTLLCATTWRVGGEIDDAGWTELRELTARAGDKRSLTIAMSGLVQLLNFHGRFREASELATELTHLLEAIGDSELTVGLTLVLSMAKWNFGEMVEAMRLAQRAIDLAAGDPTMGNLIMGSPLAYAIAMRASTRCCLGLPGWRTDFTEALSLADAVDRFSYCAVTMLKYITVMNWALLPDDDALADTAAALDIARQFGDDFLLTNAEFAHGALLVRREDTDRAAGFAYLANARRMALEHRYTIVAALCEQLDLASEDIRLGELDAAVDAGRAALHRIETLGDGINRGWATTVLVEALLARGDAGDLDEAQRAVDHLAAIETERVFAFHELPELRLRALLARARGESGEYRRYRERYRDRAAETGFQGHQAIADAMGAD